MVSLTCNFVRHGHKFFAAASAMALLFSHAAQAQESEVSPRAHRAHGQRKEDRKACKTEICKAFATPADGPAIGCTVTKTWLAADIQAGFLGGKLTWPWGHAQCNAEIELDRKVIAEAAAEAFRDHEAQKAQDHLHADHKEAKEGAASTSNSPSNRPFPLMAEKQ